LINTQKHYFDYKAYKTKKDVNENSIKAIMKEFNVSKRTAKAYIELLGVADTKAITDKWKDYLEVYERINC
jgi:predicted transcriptional regulator